VDTVASDTGLPEVISPELVLIDPELAEIARRQLREYEPPRAPPPREISPEPPLTDAVVHLPPPAARRERPRPLRALGSFVLQWIPVLVVAAVLLGMLASELRLQVLGDGASLAAPDALGWAPTRAEVEIRALAALDRSPQIQVPSGLLDEKTGQLLDNVNVTCTRSGRTSSFDCTVRAGPAQPGKWRLTVVASQHGEWMWHGLARYGHDR
jgi:hypothetical protein